MIHWHNQCNPVVASCIPVKSCLHSKPLPSSHSPCLIWSQSSECGSTIYTDMVNLRLQMCSLSLHCCQPIEAFWKSTVKSSSWLKSLIPPHWLWWFKPRAPQTIPFSTAILTMIHCCWIRQWWSFDDNPTLVYSTNRKWDWYLLYVPPTIVWHGGSPVWLVLCGWGVDCENHR